jgi:DNA helicase II / ATP-dependent DNA helicase PcrA
MTVGPFKPTDEQRRVIEHPTSAFISACPGSGKTRVMVERARILLRGAQRSRGVAFLSFTNAAISELEARLQQDGLLPFPVFPHFIGTFDSFIWQFLIAPFGVPECNEPAHLIPDNDNVPIRPSEQVRVLPLKCFDRTTGNIIPVKARLLGYNPSANTGLTKAYETIARNYRARYLARGELNFDDVRELAKARLQDSTLAQKLAAALSARFSELIVDEAQDCNPADLEIIRWLRDAGIIVKVICDPHQSIYAFRGGVTEQLIAFGTTFQSQDRLTMRGNFRSSANICKAIVILRHKDSRTVVDQALGEYRDEPAHIHILSYPGKSVSAAIGAKFQELAGGMNLDVTQCPVLAATRSSGCRAIGQPSESNSNEMTLRLAEAVTDFHFSFEAGNQRVALEELHRIALELEGHLNGVSYHQHLKAQGINRFVWRPRILQLARELRYDPTIYSTVDDWHGRAKTLLASCLPAGGSSINQRLRKTKNLANALGVAPTSCSPARTIHSVKGMQFPAVCVVMTSHTAKGILDYLETGNPVEHAEASREIYVAASRAERLLAIAIPKSQAERLANHIGSMGAQVTLTNL